MGRWRLGVFLLLCPRLPSSGETGKHSRGSCLHIEAPKGKATFSLAVLFNGALGIAVRPPAFAITGYSNTLPKW